jgi:cobaltochelatase CobS
MTRGTSPSAFNGRPRIADPGTGALVQALIARGEVQQALELAQAAHAEGDVAESQFVKRYRDGGVFLFDEMDASEPNLLLIVNAALANCQFAAAGGMVAMSRKFVPVAGMNTLGLGGDRNLVGREKQDAAALDRWNAGRTEILLDEALESKIYWSTVAA